VDPSGNTRLEVGLTPSGRTTECPLGAPEPKSPSKIIISTVLFKTIVSRLGLFITALLYINSTCTKRRDAIHQVLTRLLSTSDVELRHFLKLLDDITTKPLQHIPFVWIGQQTRTRRSHSVFMMHDCLRQKGLWYNIASTWNCDMLRTLEC
jgi:hypothetical protein